MPGTLAKQYAAMDGKVYTMGKPDPVIYNLALDALGLKPEEILAVGDSVEHDIAGARTS
jgi:HAD superfamily hydrolase (TIGR01509 family)